MMSGKPAFLICPNREADVFDTPRRPGQATATTGDPSSALADWKGERSRRGPGDASTGVTAGNEERSEPRAHESARASEVSSSSTDHRTSSFQS